MRATKKWLSSSETDLAKFLLCMFSNVWTPIWNYACLRVWSFRRLQKWQIIDNPWFWWIYNAVYYAQNFWVATAASKTTLIRGRNKNAVEFSIFDRIPRISTSLRRVSNKFTSAAPIRNVFWKIVLFIKKRTPKLVKTVKAVNFVQYRKMSAPWHASKICWLRARHNICVRKASDHKMSFSIDGAHQAKVLTRRESVFNLQRNKYFIYFNKRCVVCKNA